MTRRSITSDDEFAIAAGQAAAQSGIIELLRLHEAKVVNRLIQQYRSKTGLSPDDAKVGVAVLAELRVLAGSVDRAVERGTAVGRKLTE